MSPDYGLTGSSIKINVFDDRMEVISSGILYGNLDISDVGTGLSECRNRSIVRIFRRLNLMEELGTGIARIFELYEDRNLKLPVFAEQGQFFKAVLPQEKDISDNSEKVLDLLTRLKEASAAALAERTGLHHNTVLKHLKLLLRSSGLIPRRLRRPVIPDADPGSSQICSWIPAFAGMTSDTPLLAAG
jgi:predicted HTH transcriptional regulator